MDSVAGDEMIDQMIGRKIFECDDWITTIDDAWNEIHVYHKRPAEVPNSKKELCCNLNELSYYIAVPPITFCWSGWKYDLSSETFEFLEKFNRLQVMR